MAKKQVIEKKESGPHDLDKHPQRTKLDGSYPTSKTPVAKREQGAHKK